MSVTAAERSRATRLRRAAREGRITDEDRVWLEHYSGRVGPRGRRPAPVPGLRVVAPSDGERDPFRDAKEAAPAPSAAPAPVEKSATIPTWKPALAAPAPIEDAAPEPAAAQACSIPDCPACRGAIGGRVCPVTGKRVWPKMSEAGSKAQAAVVLNIVRTAIYYTVSEMPPAPTEKQVAKMGAGLREMAYRRASWLGAFDDLFMVGEALGDYGVHAIQDATAAKKKKARAALAEATRATDAEAPLSSRDEPAVSLAADGAAPRGAAA